MAEKIKRGWQEWENIVDAQATSGMSAKKYCEQKTIGLASFYQWRRRLSRENSSKQEVNQPHASFIDMGHIGDTRGESTENGNEYELTLEMGGGMKITIRRG